MSIQLRHAVNARMRLAEHPSVREGPARKDPQSQSSAAELSAAASGRVGVDEAGGGGRGLAPAGLPQPKPLGWGGV